MDADDPIYHQFLLRTDRNHDGLSQPSELERFSKDLSGLQMGYAYNTVGQNLDEHGNSYALVGQAIRRTEAGKNPHDFYNRDLAARTIFIYDVWLKAATGQ